MGNREPSRRTRVGRKRRRKYGYGQCFGYPSTAQKCERQSTRRITQHGLRMYCDECFRARDTALHERAVKLNENLRRLEAMGLVFLAAACFALGLDSDG